MPWMFLAVAVLVWKVVVRCGVVCLLEEKIFLCVGVGKLLRKMLSPANSAEAVGMVAPAELLALLAGVKTALY